MTAPVPALSEALPHAIPIRLRLRAFGALWMAGGLLGLVLLRLGAVRDPDQVVFWLSTVAVLWGAVMFGGAFDRLGQWYQHVAVVVVIWVVTTAYAIGGDPASDVRLYFVWSVPYVTLFFSRRAMCAHLVHAEAAFVVGMLLAGDSPSILISTWISTTVLMVVIAVLVAWAASLTETSRGQLQQQADHDALTGLPNRRLLLRLLERSLSSPDTATAVLMLDLDSFKMINDSYGHEAGDLLLQHIARRLQEVVGPGDGLARLGGDEFAVVLSESSAGLLERRIDRLGRDLGRIWRELIPIAGGVYSSGCAGVAVASDAGDGPGDLLRRADAALYQAKAVGRGTIRRYDEGLRAQLHRRLELETALRGAGDRGELRVAYQPVISFDDGRLVAAEALCRWSHPTLGPVTPDEFIPIAEESGLIEEVSRFVFSTTLTDLARWRRERLVPEAFRVAVNVSAVMVRDGLADSVAGMVAESGLSAELLAIELTESVLMADDPSVGVELDRLRAAGHRLLLDDFGTGYSALSYLARLPVDVLKLDRSFIPAASDAHDQWAVVTAVIRLAQALGISTIAEGVETADQADRLRELGCVRGQGWVFGRPVDADRFALEASQFTHHP